MSCCRILSSSKLKRMTHHDLWVQMYSCFWTAAMSAFAKLHLLWNLHGIRGSLHKIFSAMRLLLLPKSTLQTGQDGLASAMSLPWHVSHIKCSWKEKTQFLPFLQDMWARSSTNDLNSTDIFASEDWRVQYGLEADGTVEDLLQHQRHLMCAQRAWPALLRNDRLGALISILLMIIWYFSRWVQICSVLCDSVGSTLSFFILRLQLCRNRRCHLLCSVCSQTEVLCCGIIDAPRKKLTYFTRTSIK